MSLKTLNDVAIGETVFRFLGGIRTPVPLRVTTITEDRIFCGDWQFDKKTLAEIDEFVEWGTSVTGSYNLPGPCRAENNREDAVPMECFEQKS